MATAVEPAFQEEPVPAPASRVIFTEGGKGGVGKTAFATALVEWFEAQQVPYQLLDLDTENKARGSLAHYFQDKARKVNIHTAEGLDAFLDALDDGAPIVIADMGSGSGQVAYKWFDSMYESAREIGVAFTAVGIVTPDPASVESVLTWAQALQQRVEYLIVKNALTEPADFGYWERSTAAESFRQMFQPQEIEMEYRLPKFENPARQHGVTLGQAADRKVKIPELQQTTVVLRAQAYRRHLFAELDRVKDLLLL
jgi:hypothetical protein